MSSETVIFVFYWSPRTTVSKDAYLTSAVAQTSEKMFGREIGSKVLSVERDSPPTVAASLMEVTHAADSGVEGMKPLDQYDVTHWNFSDADGGKGVVVRAGFTQR